jgi:hypothetical protein
MLSLVVTAVPSPLPRIDVRGDADIAEGLEVGRHERGL